MLSIIQILKLRSKVAKHNIENGKQINWGLVARVGGGSDTWNYAFINVYETAEQMISILN